MNLHHLHICFPCRYGGRRLNPPFAETTADEDFGLVDAEPALVGHDAGEVRFHNPSRQKLTILHLDRFLSQLNGRDFMRKYPKICDYLLTGQDTVIFIEVTTSKDSVSLCKPIENTGKVRYAAGKYEKGLAQVKSACRLLNEHPCLRETLSTYPRRVCLFSYRLSTPMSTVASGPSSRLKARSAYGARYRSIESRETGPDGALLPDPDLNALGFELRRIAWPYHFEL